MSFLDVVYLAVLLLMGVGAYELGHARGWDRGYWVGHDEATEEAHAARGVVRP